MNHRKLLETHFSPLTQTVSKQECMLYALSIGLGTDPLDERDLTYLLEDRLRVFPSMACVLAARRDWLRDPAFGIDASRVVHGREKLTLHRRLPTDGVLVGQFRISEILDGGAGKAAIILMENRLIDQGSGELLATIERSAWVRGGGGFGGTARQSSPRPEVPNRRADSLCCDATSGQQALLYRLNGDYNPIHAYPDASRRAGWKQPILHGLCTFGMVVNATMKAAGLTGDGEVGSVEARFTAPVYPGECLSTELWSVSSNSWVFRTNVAGRNVNVLEDGRLTRSTT